MLIQRIDLFFDIFACISFVTVMADNFCFKDNQHKGFD